MGKKKKKSKITVLHAKDRGGDAYETHRMSYGLLFLAVGGR